MEIQRQGLTNAPGDSTEADLLHADVEAYRTWLRLGATGPPAEDAKRDIAFWV